MSLKLSMCLISLIQRITRFKMNGHIRDSRDVRLYTSIMKHR